MTPQEKEVIARWQENLRTSITIHLMTTGSDQDRVLIDFCERFAALVPGAILKKEYDASLDRPSIRINDQVIYQAVPLGPELEPFLGALANGRTGRPTVSDAVTARLQDLHVPALLKVYISPHCPHCPAVVRQLVGLCAASPAVRITIIDGTMFPEAAEQDGIQSAPTTVLDTFRWTGNIRLEELANVMVDRNPAHLGADTLRSMLHEGAAASVAEMMIQSHLIFPAFLDLLVHEKWTVRLGAMVAMETVIEKNRALAAAAIGPLKTAFGNVPDQTKGDILYILGEIGDPAALPFIEKVSTDAGDEELKSAAREAIAAIGHHNVKSPSA